MKNNSYKIILNDNYPKPTLFAGTKLTNPLD